MSTITAVRCGSCGSLFGMAHEDGSTLSIKVRDIQRLFKGGVVEGACRRCGLLVRWEAKVRA